MREATTHAQRQVDIIHVYMYMYIITHNTCRVRARDGSKLLDLVPEYNLSMLISGHSAASIASMPQWTIATNLPKEAIPKDFVKEASDLLQKAIDKPMKVSESLLPNA